MRDEQIVPDLDFDQWDAMHTRLFDRHLAALGELDDDAVLSMTTNVPRVRKGVLQRHHDGKLQLDWNGFVGTAPVHDAVRQWHLIEHDARRGAACYFGIAPRRGGTKGQGGKADVVAHTFLAADIDWAEGDHQSSSNPPREVLEEWIDDLPVAPGLIVNSGGGYHLYVTVDEPVDVQRDPRGVALYAGWRQWWIDRAAQDGFTIDIAPLTNQALVLRVAGTPCPKYQGELVHIETGIETTDDDHAIDDLIAHFPAPPAPERKRITKRDGRAQASDKSAVPAGGSLREYAPGDLFAVEGDLDRILVDLLDAEFAGAEGDSNALLLPWTDQGTTTAEYPEGKNAGVFIHHDGTPLLHIWGQGVREDWAHFAGTTPDPGAQGDVYNAFYALSQVIARLGADAPTSWSLAARLVVAYRRIDKDGFAQYGDLYDDLAAATTTQGVVALLPTPRRAPGTVRTVQGSVPKDQEKSTVRTLARAEHAAPTSTKIRRL